MATSKHFVGYGAAQAGRDYHSVDMSVRTFMKFICLRLKQLLMRG